jgi:hypothetical protein
MLGMLLGRIEATSAALSKAYGLASLMTPAEREIMQRIDSDLRDLESSICERCNP